MELIANPPPRRTSRAVFAYLFERFPKASQTFCYREVDEMFRQGERPLIFSLRRSEDLGDRRAHIVVQQVPEGDEFASLADRAAAQLPRQKRQMLRQWRGRADSLRLHQAVYIGTQLREAGITHVHAHFAGMAARTAYWIREFFGIPYSFTGHANDIFAPAKFEIGLGEIVAKGAATVVVSDFAANYLRQQFPECADRVHRIYNGVDLAQFQSTGFSQPPQILSVGRLIPKKGFDILIEACGLLREKEFRCEIIGEGPLRNDLHRLVHDRGLGDRVSLPGALPPTEVATRLTKASVFVLPARVDADGGMDNLPTVIMEAMAASVPVISTDVAGIPEMVQHQTTGFIVPQNNVKDLVPVIDRLLSDRSLCLELGRAGRQRAGELFSLDRNVAELRRIIHAERQ